jgi:ABC-type glycerol-3-phosphate transport system permease component
VALVLGTPAACAFVRCNILTSAPGYWSSWAPVAASGVAHHPLFRLVRGAGLLDTLAGLILAYSTFSLPFVSLDHGHYFHSIPRTDEAARMDGAKPLASLHLRSRCSTGLAVTIFHS